MADWSWERFWTVLEDYTPVWFALGVADVLFGLAALVSLLVQPFDTSNPGVVIAILDLVIAIAILVPLGYVLYRIRQRRRQRGY